MREFMKQLQELRDVNNAGDFVKKEKLAYTAYDFLEGFVKREKKKTIYDIKKEKVEASVKVGALKIKKVEKLSKEELKEQAQERVAASLESDCKEFKKLAYELLDIDNGVTLEWIERIPELMLSDVRKQRKNAKKAALDLI